MVAQANASAQIVVRIVSLVPVRLTSTDVFHHQKTAALWSRQITFARLCCGDSARLARGINRFARCRRDGRAERFAIAEIGVLNAGGLSIRAADRLSGGDVRAASIATPTAITHGPAGKLHWHASDPRARQELTTAGFSRYCRHRRPLDVWNKIGTMFFLCSETREAGDVEDFRGRSSRIGVDCAVCRDDRGLGAADSPVVRPFADIVDTLGKSRTAGWNGAFRVDTCRRRLHH